MADRPIAAVVEHIATARLGWQVVFVDDWKSGRAGRARRQLGFNRRGAGAAYFRQIGYEIFLEAADHGSGFVVEHRHRLYTAHRADDLVPPYRIETIVQN